MGVLAELHTANKSDSTHSAVASASSIRAPSKVSCEGRTEPAPRRPPGRVCLPVLLALFVHPSDR